MISAKTRHETISFFIKSALARRGNQSEKAGLTNTISAVIHPSNRNDHNLVCRCDRIHFCLECRRSAAGIEFRDLQSLAIRRELVLCGFAKISRLDHPALDGIRLGRSVLQSPALRTN